MRLSLIIIALFWFGQTFGQINASSPNPQLQQLTNPESTLEWMTFKKEVSITPEELVTDKGLLELNTDDKLLKISTTTDELGYEHQRYLQHYKGIPIEHAWYFVHAKNGKTQTANGKLAKGLQVDVRSVITQENALDKIVGSNKSHKYAWKDTRVEGNFKTMTNDPDASFYPKGELLITKRAENTPTEEYVLAYRFEIFSLEPHEVKAVYVDAKNGAIIKTEDLLHNAHACTGHAEDNTPATGVSNYNGTVQFTTEPTGNQYRLKNNTGQTLNAENTKDYTITDFKDTDNHWTSDRAAVDAHWGIEQAYDYFLNKHNRDSYDDNGSPVAAWVHFGNNSNIAAWNSICSCMILGDGDGEKYNSLTSLDIIGHEYAHGVTRYSSPLRYYGEAGALNESFSDIFGALIEHNHNPGADNWIIGEDVVKQSSKQGLRNLANPKDPSMITRQPDTYQGEYWYNGPLDNGGIHTNSGVQNYWFYLLANGGSGVNDNGDYYSVEGIGIDKAAQITYRNLTVYTQAGSTYVGAAVGSTTAAEDIFGVGSYEAEQVKRAWCAVGMPANYCGQYSTSCSVRDSLALVALYNSTQGNTWRFRWNLNNPISTWRGVTVNAEGCVSRLKLSGYRLKGTLPPEFGNLLDIEYIKIDNNSDLVGSIPPEFGNLTKLEDAILYYNNFSGSLPTEIGNLSSINQLMLDGNKLTGDLPVSIKNLPNTAFLTFSNNQLDNLPDLSGLPSTFRIYARGNKLTFEDIAPNRNVLVSSNQYKPQRKIGETKTLQLTPDENYTIKLNIDTYVEDNIYKWYKDGVLVGTTNKDEFTISDFSSTKVGVYTCKVTNSGASSLTLESYPVTIQSSPMSCRQRDSLALVEFYHATKGQYWKSDARWDLEQPMNTWYGLTFNEEGCVTEIHLFSKRLRGNLPPEIGNLLSLERISITNAFNSGTTIPPEIGKLVNLRELSLRYCDFADPMPAEIGNLVNLERLDLVGNGFKGEISPGLGKLTNLYYLNLSQNQFTGAVPTEFTNMANLEKLFLRYNQLSDLPFMNDMAIDNAEIRYNRFTFEDIVPNIDIMGHYAGGHMSYEIQSSVGRATTFTLSPGDKLYIDLDIDHDMADNVYQWYKNNTLIQTITGSPVFQKTIQSADDTGTYTCRVTNANAPALTLHSQAYTVEFEPMTNVYPGDFNNDGKVDGTDALFWGLTYGRTGIPRPNASLTWTGQPCFNWNISHLNVNGKHQDANGDGIVNEADLEAVNINYGRERNNGDPNAARQAPLSLNYEVVSSSENAAGQAVHVIDITLVNNVNDAPISIHGLSFGFEFLSDNMNYLSSDIDISSSWLGDEDSLTVVAQDYPANSRASYTITRNDLEDRTASTLNPIVQLIVTADDHESGDPLDFTLNFDNIMASSASSGDIMSLEAGGSSLRIAQEAALIIENIYPNPTHAAQGITLMLNTDTDYGEGHINITDILGKTLIQQPVHLRQGEQQLHVLTDRLQSGIYTVHLGGSGWHSQAQQFIIIDR